MKKLIVAGLGIAMIASMAFDAAAKQKYVQVKGSDTLINMMQKLAEVYMAENPGKAVSVTGGGSGTGIASIINGTADIANASRLMKDKEIQQAVQNNVNPVRVVVALDSLCIVVNPNNPVQQLTVEDIAKIYRGEVANWKEVGGEDLKISLYGRQPNSGTYDFMKDDILKSDYSPKMRQMNGNAQIIEAIKADRSAVGYVGVGYAKEAGGIGVAKVAAKVGGTYYDPFNTEDVKNGNYPITRPLQQYINGQAAGDVKEFIQFELSPKGQEIVEKEGFFAIPEEYKDVNKKAGL